jgi:PhnB protein
MLNQSNHHHTVTPFIITKDASKLIAFMEEVFGSIENMEKHGLQDDGLLIHSEVTLGDSTIFIADRKPDWPYTPSFIRVYVDDIEDTLKRATDRGAEIITKPTDFYGEVLSRFKDPWGNLWWVNKPGGVSWGGTDQSEETAKQYEYVIDTIVEAMKHLKG